MRYYERLAGSTSQQFRVRAYVASTGLPKTGLVYNTSGLIAYYTRDGAAPVAITLATQTINGAWSSGGFVLAHDTNAPGEYRLDVPDAALATGSKGVSIILSGVSDVVFEPLEIELRADVDPFTIPIGPRAAFSYVFAKAATSKTIYIYAEDAATKTAKTGCAYNTSGLTAAYYRQKASAGTAITLASLSAPDAAWSSGGYKEVDATKLPGIYRLDLPDAALATGVDEVWVRLLLAGVTFTPVQITLTASDPLLPAPTAAENRAEMDSNSTKLAAIKAQTDLLPSDPADESLIIAATDAIIARLPTLTAGGFVKASIEAILDDTNAPIRQLAAELGITTFVVGSGSTTTSIVTSSMDPAANSTNQFKDGVVYFKKSTTTTGLRGARKRCSASSSGGVLTVDALPTAPVSGDVGVIL